MMSITTIIFHLGLGILAFFYLIKDTRRLGLNIRFFYVWSFAVVLAYVVFDIIGISLVIVVYIAWSRFFFKSSESSEEIEDN